MASAKHDGGGEPVDSTSSMPPSPWSSIGSGPALGRRRNRRSTKYPPTVSFQLHDVHHHEKGADGDAVDPAAAANCNTDSNLPAPLLNENHHESTTSSTAINVNTGNMNTSSSTPQKYSLATDPSTPRLAAILLSTLTVLTHALFLYGQIAPMWRLRASASIDVWANATTVLSRRTFAAIGLDKDTHVQVEYNDDVSTFTYFFAIKQLWIAAGLPSKFMSKLAAVLLVFFSGIWPHLKLLLLHATFRIPYSQRLYQSRTASLYWLGTFGKWTLADVFVVCALIGIVALNWDVDPGAVRDGLSSELPTLVVVAKSMYTPTEACTRMLGLDCAEPSTLGHRTKCWTCEAAVNEAYDHPDWARGAGREVLKGVATEGGGVVDLRVAGMRGIYPFCAAAILSLMIGVAVDVLDHRARVRSAKAAAAAAARNRNTVWEDGEEDEDNVDETDVEVLLGNDDDDSDVQVLLGADTDQPPSASNISAPAAASPSTKGCSCGFLFNRVLMAQAREGVDITFCYRVTAWLGYGVLMAVSLLVAGLVYFGCTMPTMEREVVGAIPEVAQNVMGIDWERPYSLQSLVEVSGAEGGLDYMLMGTFALFVLVGPIARSILCVANLLLPWSKGCHELLLMGINILGAFSAWEVFAIATYMVDDLIPSVTKTIIHKPICDQLSPETNSCLMIEFNILNSFVGLLVVGGTLLVLLSTVSVRLGFKGTDPYKDGDAGGPYCRELCCCGSDGAGDGGGLGDSEGDLELEYHRILDEGDLASETDVLL